jgi:hypothetical protein
LWTEWANLTRNWHDGPVPPGMLALACRLAALSYWDFDGCLEFSCVVYGLE